MNNKTDDSSVKKRSPLGWIPSVYFGMGLPFVALSAVSTLMFMDLGVDKVTIASWTSLLLLPWSLKPIFSLIMELVGRKHQYIIATEAIAALMFGLLAFTLMPSLGLEMGTWFPIAIALMGVIAVGGSMHDIAGDGVYMEQLSSSEQGQWSGWQGAFYNLAKILANGGLVWLAGFLGTTLGLQTAWAIIMAATGAIMLSLAGYHILMLPRETTDISDGRKTMDEAMRELGEVVVSFFRKPYIWLYLAFIFLYRFTEGLAMKMAPIFLKDAVELGGIGLSNEQFGLIYGTAGTVAFIVGSILAGYFIGHYGLRRVLRMLVIIFNATFAVYYVLALYQPESIWAITLGIVFEYFCYGFGFVGVILFMMQQIAPGKYQMAHYAFANSLMNISFMVPGIISGWLCQRLGYETFFLVSLLMALPVVVLSFFLPFAHEEKK